MDIYTTENHSSINKQCVTVYYGQLRNENMHTPIRPGRYRFTECTSYQNGPKLRCHGKSPIQDYKPRFYGFSFGFNCGRYQRTESLKGLSFNVSIYDETNETTCIQIPIPKYDVGSVKCSRYYSHTSLPNLVGDS